MKTYEDTTIIIPTLNEEKNIGKLIAILERMYKGVYIIVADDGSKDKTQQIVNQIHKKNSHVLLMNRKSEPVKGLTASVVDGFLWSNTKYSVVIDADLQHPPDKIALIVEKLRSGYDLVTGHRAKICIDWPWYRRVITKTGLAAGKLRLLIKGAISKDILSGYFGMQTKLVQKIIRERKDKFEMEGYKVLFDILKGLNKKTKIYDFPFSFDVRKEGHSKLTNKVMMTYLKSIFK
ncbi:MAG TPA: glycosyltransferase [Candidatus Nanoarchaeia archaeon]|nr:glycosyltransferase [Candidatus Nanoarchaeia archaeon]